MIPKIIHIIWIGDESKRPDESIATWSNLNSEFEIRIWSNRDLSAHPWINGRHMKEQARVRLSGVANMMRYEILYHHGGIYVDADSVCTRPLEDWILEPESWAVWENEHLRPGLIANTFLGARPSSPLFGQMVADIYDLPTVTDEASWITTGPLFLTNEWKKYQYPLTVWPSHLFIPNHYAGLPYEGPIKPFADHHWYTTHQISSTATRT